MVVLESCVNNILKLGPALLVVGAPTSADKWRNGVIIIDTIGTPHPSNWAKFKGCVILKKDGSRLSKAELEELISQWYNLPDMRQRLQIDTRDVRFQIAVVTAMYSELTKNEGKIVAWTLIGPVAGRSSGQFIQSKTWF